MQPTGQGTDDSMDAKSVHVTTIAAYQVSDAWVADLVLKANRLVGKYTGLLDSHEQREHAVAFTCNFMYSLATGQANTEARAVIYTMSQLRKAINALILEAGTPMHSVRPHLSYGAFDLLLTASRQQNQIGSIMSNPSEVRSACVQGMQVLRSMLADATKHYMEGWEQEPMPIMRALVGQGVPRAACRALSMQFLATLFDSTRLAAGARLAHRAFGELAPLGDEVRRCELGRSDAYMANRLYVGLQIIIGMMLMGVAKRAEREGNRDKWNLSLPGRAVLAFRTSVGETLKAYDESKREPAERAGKTYTAQTPGSVATLQEQAAMLASHVNEPDSALYDALVAGLGEAKLFSVNSDTAGNDGDEKLTFWLATSSVASTHARKFSHGNNERVPSWEAAMTMTTWMVVSSVMEKHEGVVQVSSSMRVAMKEAAKSWPAVSNFYGRDYEETERKVTAKAAREGRDPQGREVGEAFGYRLEWMGYLANGAPARPVSRGGVDDQLRLAGAITVLARVETLECKSGRRALPLPSGNSIHHVHGVGLDAEPGMVELCKDTLTDNLSRSVFYEAGDMRYRRLAEENRDKPLFRKQLFVERVLERTAPMFKAWSGGVLVSEPYYDFFAEVWKRFNDSLRHQSSPWGAKIARWLEHYQAGTAPPRANGEAKLIHPWRAQYLQQGIARALLEEKYGETKLVTMEIKDRAATRMHRALLSGVIEAYDYAPWASHLVRRFCTMDEHRTAAKRKREEDDRVIMSLVMTARRDKAGPRGQGGGHALSPSLARSAGPIEQRP